MAPRIKLVLEYKKPLEQKQKAVKGAIKEGLLRVGHQWHEKFARRHFESGARARYGYKARSAEYMKRKARTKHHGRPMVWSGLFESMVVDREPTYKATGTGNLTMRHTVPYYVKMRRKSGSSPNMELELSVVRQDEADELMKVFKGAIDGALER